MGKCINKVGGKYVKNSIRCLQDHGNMVIIPQNVAHNMADHYYTVGSNDEYDAAIYVYKEMREK